MDKKPWWLIIFLLCLGMGLMLLVGYHIRVMWETWDKIQPYLMVWIGFSLAWVAAWVGVAFLYMAVAWAIERWDRE